MIRYGFKLSSSKSPKKSHKQKSDMSRPYVN
ncbi:Uncharacterised protein [Vibrio cholerae]|nr:Uncharacterised protein [Vibrio cholerae]